MEKDKEFRQIAQSPVGEVNSKIKEVLEEVIQTGINLSTGFGSFEKMPTVDELANLEVEISYQSRRLLQLIPIKSLLEQSVDVKQNIN